MKYSCEVTINLPRQRVIELFDSVENLKKWQPGLQDFEHLSGEPGQTGATSKMRYDMNGRKVEMIETITKRNLPDEFTATYDAGGVHNIVANHFYEDGPDKTRWVTENEFQLRGLMAIMGLFMGGTFRKQTMDDMNRFKTFAENA